MKSELNLKKEFYHQAQIFLTTLWEELNHSDLHLKEYWMWDHLCYRVDTLARYQYWFDQLSQWGELLIESEVGNRMISTFKLNYPISFQGKTIELIELPAPKAGSFYTEGFEHLEIVCDETFAEIKKRYPQIQFSDTGEDKIWNPELKFKLGKHSIKFHHSSLESVIRFEKCIPEWNALKELDLLQKLKAFSPLVAGTFPLGIALDSSDIDILITTSQFDDLSRLVKANYGELNGFKTQYYTQQLPDQILPTWTCHFQFKGVAFELFAQEIESIHQRGYRHFQIEERLLKIGGSSLQQKMIALKKAGYKTEPAFAQILGMMGDPYESLLKLQYETETNLKKRLTHRHIEFNSSN